MSDTRGVFVENIIFLTERQAPNKKNVNLKLYAIFSDVLIFYMTFLYLLAAHSHFLESF